MDTFFVILIGLSFVSALAVPIALLCMTYLGFYPPFEMSSFGVRLTVKRLRFSVSLRHKEAEIEQPINLIFPIHEEPAFALRREPHVGRVNRSTFSNLPSLHEFAEHRVEIPAGAATSYAFAIILRGYAREGRAEIIARRSHSTSGNVTLQKAPRTCAQTVAA